mmetsp:Transcript_10566/g.23797  ORF Transcript_10566/g.23797 Transcript_10566/m.23797 type:complete len:169 (-) Transcript_10566:67-573(-)
MPWNHSGWNERVSRESDAFWRAEEAKRSSSTLSRCGSGTLSKAGSTLSRGYLPRGNEAVSLSDFDLEAGARPARFPGDLENRLSFLENTLAGQTQLERWQLCSSGQSRLTSVASSRAASRGGVATGRRSASSRGGLTAASSRTCSTLVPPASGDGLWRVSTAGSARGH